MDIVEQMASAVPASLRREGESPALTRTGSAAAHVVLPPLAAAQAIPGLAASVALGVQTVQNSSISSVKEQSSSRDDAGGKKKKKSKKSKKGGDEREVARGEPGVNANDLIMGARLESTEHSLEEYKKIVVRLRRENAQLQHEMNQTEKDTIEVISFMRRESDKKDELIVKLQRQIREQRKEFDTEKETMAGTFQQRLSALDEAVSHKEEELGLAQQEMKVVKEFRKKRTAMQKELDRIKSQMGDVGRKHADTISRMEHKFFEEKVRLQKEANKKISELAEKAHEEAVSNLDETTKAVFKENVRLAEALRFHHQEGEELKKAKLLLMEQIRSLSEDRELNRGVVQEKIGQSQKQAQLIRELGEKVQTLEKSLSQVVKDFDAERRRLKDQTEIQLSELIATVDDLRRTLALKTKEMNHVKRLSRNILDQRTDLEQFFIDSLELVKKEIAGNRAQYKKEAAAAYNQQMRLATMRKNGQGFPAIRTFHPSATSTNSIFMDFSEAERRGYDIQGTAPRMDITDLTWEERERVLRIMFAKLNGTHIGGSGDGHGTLQHALANDVLEEQSMAGSNDDYDAGSSVAGDVSHAHPHAHAHAGALVPVGQHPGQPHHAANGGGGTFITQQGSGVTRPVAGALM
eukprot:Opistho-2@75922